METTVKLYSLTYKEVKTYWFALIFIVGNILLPQLCHLIPGGGLVWLPIYFFTLIAAYKYGLGVGLLTAILSPVVNSFLFGMPPLDVLPAVLIKSVLLAGAASFLAHRFQRISILAIAGAVFVCQFFGTLIEWGIVKDWMTAVQDLRIGIPGILVQIAGGYAVLKVMARL